jgi:hypothetical protein
MNDPRVEIGLIAVVAGLVMCLFAYGLYRIAAWWVDRRSAKAMEELNGRLMTPPEDCADVCADQKPARLKALR